MPRVRAAALLLVLLASPLAGCLWEDDSDPGQAEIPDATPTPAAGPVSAEEAPPQEAQAEPEAAGGADAAQAPAAEEVVTRFSWSSASLAGPLALRFRFALADPTHCSFEAAIANARMESGMHTLMILSENGMRIATGAGGSESAVRAQVLDAIDTDEQLGPEGGSATQVRGDADLGAGEFSFTLVGRNVQASENDLTRGAAMRLEIACERPFSPAGVSGSREVFLVDEQTGPLAYAGTSPRGYAALAASQGGDLSSPEVVAVVSGWGTGVSHIILDHPEGKTEAILLPEAGGDLDRTGGPGAWRVTLQAGAGALTTYYGALFGLAPLPAPEAL